MRSVDRPRMVCTYCVVQDYTCTVTARGYTRRAQDTARGAAPDRNRSCHVVDRSQCSVLTTAHCRPLSCASKLSLLTNRDCHRKTSIL